MRGGRTRFGATPASGQQPPGAWGCKRGCGRQGGGQRVRARGITMLLSAARKTRLGTRVTEERADGLGKSCREIRSGKTRPVRSSCLRGRGIGRGACRSALGCRGMESNAAQQQWY